MEQQSGWCNAATRRLSCAFLPSFFSLSRPSVQELVTNTDEAFVAQAVRLITNHTHYTSFSSRVPSLPLDALLFSSAPAALYPLVFDYLLRNHNEIKKTKAGMLDLRHLG